MQSTLCHCTASTQGTMWEHTTTTCQRLGLSACASYWRVSEISDTLYSKRAGDYSRLLTVLYMRMLCLLHLHYSWAMCHFITNNNKYYKQCFKNFKNTCIDIRFWSDQVLHSLFCQMFFPLKVALCCLPGIVWHQCTSVILHFWQQSCGEARKARGGCCWSH